MRLLFAMIFLALFSVASATDYYVKNGGNNSADGRSDATAWADISKVNSSTFNAGDVIHFRCGDTWRDLLNVPSEGTNGAYLKFANYGTGSNPRILGSNTTTWSNVSGNVWVSDNNFTNPYSVGQYGAEIFFENSDGSVTWGVRKSGTSTLTAEFNWAYSSSKIYIYSSTDPDTKYRSVEIPQRAYIINLNKKNYINIDGIDVFYCGETGITFDADGVVPMPAKTGLIIENLEIGYISTKDSEAGYGTEAIYSDMIVRHCDIHDCGRRPVSFHFYGIHKVTNILIEDNYFHDGWHTTGPDFSVGLYPGGTIDGAIIRRNMIYDPQTRGTGYSDQIFLQNYLYSSLQSQLKNIYIYSNIFITPCGGASINLEGTQSIYIYNNTFVNHNIHGSAAHIWVDNNNALVRIKNNIFYSIESVDTRGRELFVRSGTAAANVDADYNLYYRVNNNLRIIEKENMGIYYMNTPFPLPTGWEANGKKANPVFYSLSDYRLQEGSPALGTGVSIPEVTTDYEGNAFTSPPNIGCYGSAGVPPELVYVSSVIQNNTPSILEMTYNLSMANIVPAPSTFTVIVNSIPRAVSSVSVSGTTVLLTLSSPVGYGSVVTVAYTRPSINPLQTTSGNQAASITNQAVTNNVVAANPVYVSSVITSTTPSVLEMTYDLNLANIVPEASAFTVLVNSAARTVTSVSISGTKVLLTLSSPVVAGDVITVAYTKPASNPLQTTFGGQAASISAQAVTNNVAGVIPVYVSSAVTNPAPYVVGMTYSQTLANIVPTSSAFTVMVNSSARAVSSVNISGTMVFLTLVSPVVYGDVVTVAYTKPSVNPLQTASGGQAASITAQPVTNNVAAVVNPDYVSSVIENATPTILEITYSLALANIVPSPSSFIVMVNSAARSVNSVSISGTKVLLTLASPVAYGDIITVAYTKPSANPLQTASGGQAATISAQTVINNIADPDAPAIKIFPNPANQIINIRIIDPVLAPDFIRIINLLGVEVLHDIVNPDVREFQIPVNLLHVGIYVVQIGSDNKTHFSQKLAVFR